MGKPKRTYLNDLDENMAAAEHWAAEAEACIAKGWGTAADVCLMTLAGHVKTLRHCIKCAKKKKGKDKNFSCVGGCTRARGMDDLDNKLKNIQLLRNPWGV